jgi:hypothetical protein
VQKLLFLCGCVLLTCFSFGQLPAQIEWGPENIYRPNMLSILPKNNGSFFTFHYTNSSLLPTPKISRFDNCTEVLSKKIEQRIGDKMVTLQDVFVFSNRLFCLFSDLLGSTVSLYIQEYDTEADQLGPALEFASYPIPKGWVRDVFISMSKSPKENFLVVDYLIPAKKAEFDQFGYVILDKQLGIHQRGDYEIPFDTKLTAVETRHVTDAGEYFLGVSVFRKANSLTWKNFDLADKSVIMHLDKSDSLQIFEVNTEFQKVFNYTISSNLDQVLITGTWGNIESHEARGVFTAAYLLSSDSFSPPIFINFDEGQFPSDPPAKATALDYGYSNIDNDLLNYAFRDVFYDESGNAIVLAEQYYINEVLSIDSRGMSQVTNYYYYNDCLVYSINPQNGTLNWLKKIPKKQASVNDFGQFSSLVSYVSNKKLHVFFNDVKQNYEEMGSYNGNKFLFSNTTRYKDYCLAQATIDLEDGETKRSILSNYEPINGFVCLKLSAVNLNAKQLIFAASRKKDKYGILMFE